MISIKNKELYLAEARKWLTKLYQELKNTQHEDPLLKEFINGYLYSGIVVGIMSQKEVNEFIDQINIEIFDMPLLERKQHYRLSADLQTDFESPTYERLGLKIGI